MPALSNRARPILGTLPFAAAPWGALLASGSSNLDQTNALVWVLVAIGAAGAFVTFAFLVYAIWKVRDPRVRRRRYG